MYQKKDRSKKEHKTLYPTAHSHGKYIKMGPNDIGKRSIPYKDRCEGFDELWEMIYYQVLETWDWVPVTDLKPFGGEEIDDN